MKHKRQHYVPKSYLQAWCDPNCPPGQTPYVWVFSKGGGRVRKKSPEKLFRETDMYTVRTDDGQRDLTLETNLSRLEGEYSKLRKAKLGERLPLSSVERLYLCMFVAAMHGRTRAFAEHWRDNWGRVSELGEKMERAYAAASEEQRERMAATLRTPGGSEESSSMTLEEVRELAERPIQGMLSGTVMGVAPMLFKLPFVVLETSTAPGFITSDAPCVWFDPADYQTPRPRFAGGLESPTIQITLPLSPEQMLIFYKRFSLPGAYVHTADHELVNLLNKKTRVAAHEYFVANSPKAPAAWF